MDRHFFGSTAFNWAVGSTREEVLGKLARAAGSDIIKANVKRNGGLYAWTCMVPLPESADYAIHNYAPVNVGACEVQEFNIMYINGASLPITREPPAKTVEAAKG